MRSTARTSHRRNQVRNAASARAAIAAQQSSSTIGEIQAPTVDQVTEKAQPPTGDAERSEADDAAPAAAAERSEADAAELPPASERQRSQVAAGFRLPGEKRSSRKRKKPKSQA